MKRIATSIILVSCAAPLLLNCGETFLGGGLRGTGGTGGDETSGHGHGVAVTSGTGTSGSGRSGPATVGAGGASGTGTGGACGAGGGSPLDDGNPCTQNLCQDGISAYVPLPEGTACSLDPCIVGQTCHAGVCNGGGPMVCEAGTSCVAGACVAPCTGPFALAPPVAYPVDTTPNSFATADLNGDGKPDLAVAGSSTGGDLLTVMFGNGDGTFAPKVDYSIEPSQAPLSIAAADLNGDGKPDIVIAHAESATVSVFLNNGSGTFAPKVDYALDQYPRAASVVDLNGDGKPDIITANNGPGISPGTVSVLFGNGDGTFVLKGDQVTGALAYSMVVADLNGDGKPDLAITNVSPNDVVSVLFGNGDGTFAPKVDYAGGSRPWNLAVADLNGDGKLDLAVSNYGSNTASVLLNNGDGTFAAKVDYATGTNPQRIVAADMNGDGKPDLVVADNGDSDVSVLLNNGDGTFAARVTYPVAGIDPSAVAALDLTGDGKPDIVVADVGPPVVSVLLNTCHP